MKNMVKLSRILILFVAAVLYAKPALASALYVSCNTYCSGSVRIHECYFEDEHAEEPNNPFTCYGWPPYWYQTTYIKANNWCANQASAAGSGGLEWFSTFSCSDGTPAVGNFYCSYDDDNCP